VAKKALTADLREDLSSHNDDICGKVHEDSDSDSCQIG